MTDQLLTTTVAELAERDSRLKTVFETFGINHCCAGRVPLRQAAAAAGVALDTLMAALRAAKEPLDAPDTLDVRGLEPPEPLVKILERAASLRPGETLMVVHDRRPIFLYPQLDQRGLRYETDEPETGVVRIRITRTA